MQSAINAHRHENGRLHAARKVARRPASGMALWRSGDAADCKSVYAGSIPAGASRPSSIDRIPCIHAVFPQALPCAGRKFRSLTKKCEFSASRLDRVNQFRRLLTLSSLGDTHHHPTPRRETRLPPFFCAFFSCDLKELCCSQHQRA